MTTQEKYTYQGKKLSAEERAQRLQSKRHAMIELSPEERIRSFTEVNCGYTPAMAQAEAARCLLCPAAPCVQGCPVGVRIPAMLEAVAEGRFEDAVRILWADNALPAVTGRVCPQEEQCEGVCTLGKARGEPVGIGYVERFLADWARSQRLQPSADTLVRTQNPKKVAIIGSGPGGLTAASDLARMGHEVHIFEAFHEAGGVLIYGIPEFRLPKAIVHAEVESLKALGVHIHTNAVVGTLYSLEELLTSQGFSAVFLAIGAGLPKFMNIPGENLNGVYSANEYLTRVNLMKAYQFPCAADTPVLRGKRVAVVGGGNVAMDAVRTARRLGAEEAILIYRRSRDEMPARREEIHHAEEEGVKFLFLTNPVRYVGTADGWVSGVECVRMELGEPDASGRRSPVVVSGSEFVLPIDIAIVAIGTSANPLLTHATPQLKCNRSGYIQVDEKLRTSMRGVFAGGDIVRGAATVILAMGDGRKAARFINEYLETGEWVHS